MAKGIKHSIPRVIASKRTAFVIGLIKTIIRLYCLRYTALLFSNGFSLDVNGRNPVVHFEKGIWLLSYHLNPFD